MIRHGEWEYTEDDARATLRHGLKLLDLLVDGLDPDVLDPVADRLDRARAQAAAAVDDTGPLDARLARLAAARALAAGAVRASGALGPAERGTVAHLARGPGGVPKAGCDEVEVDWHGVVGDAQADRANHGRPWQALCLWSTEVIEAFVAAGHALAPGRAGENITLSGIAWERVRPGTILEIGEVVCEVWAYTTPCRKNARWFTGGRVDLMHHRHGPVSRVYGQVLQPGTIRVGDPVATHRGSGPLAALEGVDALSPDDAAAVRALMDRAFADFTDDDWEHALGGHHAIGRLPDGSPVAHAAVVRRTIHVDDQALRAGYVEAVATDPAHQGRSFGGQVMEVIGRTIHARHELGVLATSAHGFYERLGWERWRGPTFVRAVDGTVHRTAEEDDAIMVLRTDASRDIDLSAPITCEERPGDDW